MKCNLYGVDDTKFILGARCRDHNGEKKFFKLVKCRKCGLVYLNTRLDKEEIKRYYPPWYHSRAHTKVIDITKTKIWGIPWREADSTPGSSWISSLHLFEYLIFSPVAYFMNKIEWGSNLLAIARREG